MVKPGFQYLIAHRLLPTRVMNCPGAAARRVGGKAGRSRWGTRQHLSHLRWALVLRGILGDSIELELDLEHGGHGLPSTHPPPSRPAPLRPAPQAWIVEKDV